MPRLRKIILVQASQLPWRLLQPLSNQGGDDTTGRGAAGLVLLAGLAGAGDGGQQEQPRDPPAARTTRIRRGSPVG